MREIECKSSLIHYILITWLCTITFLFSEIPSYALVEGTVTGNAANSIAIGVNSSISGTTTSTANSIALGSNASVEDAECGTAIGSGATISGGGGCNVAIGNNAQIYNSAHAYQLGCNAVMTDSAEAYSFGHYSTITNSAGAYTLGVSASVTNAANAYAIGYKASSTAANSIALGSNSVADTAYTISVGNSSGTNYRIVNMASGLADKDAVNVAQLKAIGNTAAAALGGSSTYTFSSAGVSTLSPSFILEGVTYSNVQSALSSLEYSVRYDSPDKNTITLGGTMPVTVSNVADGTKAGDAVNFGQSIVKYGPHETVMQKITESGIEEVSWEAAEDAVESSGTGNSGSGCNMGFGVIALLAGVPLLKKHNR